MELVNWIKNKLPLRKQDSDDRNDPANETISFPPQPHQELYGNIRHQRPGDYHYIYEYKMPTMSCALWDFDEKGRVTMFSCYLINANCLLVVTKDDMDVQKYQNDPNYIEYHMYVYTGKSFLDWHLGQFQRPEPTRLQLTHVIHVTVIQKHSIIVVFGIDSTDQLMLYCYSIQYNTPFSFHSSSSEGTNCSEDHLLRTGRSEKRNDMEPGEIPISVHCTKPYVIKEDRLNKLLTSVVAESQDDGTLAVIFTNSFHRPHALNLLYIWKIVPKVVLLKSVDLNTLFRIRGLITGLCFWNNQQDLIFATNASQLFHLSLENKEYSKNYINLKSKDMFLEDDNEVVRIIKVEPKCQQNTKIGLYAIGECGDLYIIPPLKDWRSQPVKRINLSDKLRIGQYTRIYSPLVSSYSKLLFLLSENKYLCIYNLVSQTCVNAVKLFDDNRSDVSQMNMSINWYGTEVYFTILDRLFCVACPVVDKTLKEMARNALLKSYSEKVLMDLNLSKSILDYIFDEDTL